LSSKPKLPRYSRPPLFSVARFGRLRLATTLVIAAALIGLIGMLILLWLEFTNPRLLDSATLRRPDASDTRVDLLLFHNPYGGLQERQRLSPMSSHTTGVGNNDRVAVCGGKRAGWSSFYSRIGFVHEFRPMGASAVRQLLEQHWALVGVKLPQRRLNPETVAVIIRVTGGNFRLLNRLLTQIRRILEINTVEEITKTMVDAARESLVIGQV
jgi:hypothetical protein